MSVGKIPINFLHNWLARISPLIAGLLVTAVLVSISYGAAYQAGGQILAPMVLALVFGALWGNLWPINHELQAGVKAISQFCLRAGIIVMGVRIGFQELLDIGLPGLITALSAVVATIGGVILLGRWLKVESGLAILIAAGTAICGASAILAVNAVTQVKPAGVATAVGAITLVGTVCMLAYPALATMTGMDPEIFGIWTGASIHEVAQVAVASQGYGTTAENAAMIVKLTRVLLLVPVVLVLCLATRQQGRPTIPLFILGFLAVVVGSNLGLVPPALRTAALDLVPILFTFAMTGIGIQLRVKQLAGTATSAILLCLLGTLLVSGLSLMVSVAAVGAF